MTKIVNEISQFIALANKSVEQYIQNRTDQIIVVSQYSTNLWHWPVYSCIDTEMDQLYLSSYYYIIDIFT